MQKVEEKELKKLQGGAGHYHWICKVGKNFTSANYSSYASAGKAADKHIAKYPAHAKRVSVKYCEKTH